MSKISLSVMLLLPLLVFPSCLRDFEQFDASGGGAASGDGDGDGEPGGAPGDGGTPSGDGGGDQAGDGDGDQAGDGDGDGDTGSGGAQGGAPNPVCEANEKLCGGNCTPNDDPATGCSDTGCEPCPSAPHREVLCSSGSCSLGQCEAGFLDCDASPENGCEHSSSTFSELSCGGCDADCTTLGLTNCQGVCGCAQHAECGDTRRNVVCTDRLCVCDEVACRPGETCGRVGNTSVCECGGEGACSDGWVCCPASSGAACKQLDASDVSNCGACGFQCRDFEVCVNGTCQ